MLGEGLLKLGEKRAEGKRNVMRGVRVGILCPLRTQHQHRVCPVPPPALPGWPCSLSTRHAGMLGKQRPAWRGTESAGSIVQGLLLCVPERSHLSAWPGGDRGHGDTGDGCVVPGMLSSRCLHPRGAAASPSASLCSSCPFLSLKLWVFQAASLRLRSRQGWAMPGATPSKHLEPVVGTPGCWFAGRGLRD